MSSSFLPFNLSFIHESPEDDAVTQNWGSKWRMPTDEECKELTTKCKWRMTPDYCGTSVRGFIITGKNGNSIFLPIAGVYNVAHATTYNELLFDYWSSYLDKNDMNIALSLGTDYYPFPNWDDPSQWEQRWFVVHGDDERCSGIAVRAVCR